MNHTAHPSQSSAGTSLGAVILVGGVSLAVVGALQLAGQVDRWNLWLCDAIELMLGEALSQRLPTWSWWVLAALFAFGLPALLLPIACAWKRWTIWLVASGLMVLWAPVLGLASHRPELILPWIATACSGLLVLLCAGRASEGGEDVNRDLNETS